MFKKREKHNSSISQIVFKNELNDDRDWVTLFNLITASIILKLNLSHTQILCTLIWFKYEREGTPRLRYKKMKLKLV